jgi:hypothetical protein
MADDLGDVFDPDPRFGQQRYEAVPQLPRRPVVAYSGGLGHFLEIAAYVVCVQWGANRAGENQAGLCP